MPADPLLGQSDAIVLSTDEERTLRALPDPGGVSVMQRAAVRASDLVAQGCAGYPVLDRLEAAGLATGTKGWWKKTREGVLYLRGRS